MKRVQLLVPLLGAVAALAPVAGCGDEGATCGAGTTEQNGTCVPTSTTTCGTGTVLMGGQCVPDGSVICEQGTTFDQETGKCEVDPSACADGTVFVEGECVPEDDTLTADLDEAAEPNDATGAGLVNVPALNGTTSIHGCVTPRGGQADQDPWILTSSGPALLEITADGVGGLAAAFQIQALDVEGLDNFARIGINLSGDTSKRQVYLPAAGDYVLLLDDSRAMLTGEATGNAETCYYTTIKHVALPTATPLTVPQTAGQDDGNVKVYSYTPGQAGDIFDVTQTTTSASMIPAFIVRKNGQFYASTVYDTANDVPPFYTVGGLAPTDVVDVIVDEFYNLAATPQPYVLESFDIAADALPTDGTSVTLTKKNGTIPGAPWWEPNFSYFDVTTANQIVNFNVTSSVGVTMRIVRADVFTPTGALNVVASINTSTAGATSFANQYVRFRQPGRYYFHTFHSSGTGGDTYTLTATLTNMATTPVTYDTALTNQALPAQGSAFHSLDLSSNVRWLEVAITGAANWGAGNARVTLYDLAGEGWLTTTTGNYLPIQASATQPTDGSAPLGRITLGDTRDYLIRIENTGTPDAGPTYDLHVRERPHTLLGTADPATPINRTGMDNLAGGATRRYLVFGTAGHRLRAQATPLDATADIRIDRRNADESIPTGGTANTGGVGVAEALSASFAATPNFIAFTVTNSTAAVATDVDLAVTATAPIPYVDICPTGTALPAPHNGAADDEYTAVQTLPAGFTYFGAAVTEFIVGANGFLVFGNTTPTCSFGCFSNGALPSTGGPNNFIAAYWDDLDTIRVCRKDDAVANTVTVQWTGFLIDTSTAVQFQTVLHQNGTVDLIYGPGHQATGSSATVGVEGPGGTAGILVGRDTAGTTPPGSSYTIPTP